MQSHGDTENHPPPQHLHQTLHHKDKNGLKETDFPQYENTETLKKGTYVYHDEPHSFENTIEFMEDASHFTYEVLETTV